LPLCRGLVDAADPDRLREIVRAANRNDQRWDLLLGKAAEMAMDGAVAAEDQRGVRLVGAIEFIAGEKTDARQPKTLQVPRLGIGSEQGDGAHRATVAHQTMKTKSAGPCLASAARCARVKHRMKPRFFKSPADFRAWLEKNHASERELLVGFYRRDSGKGGITYPEALGEALCFGWIDGLRKRYDEASYTVRFSQRKVDSIWSAVNTRRVGELMQLKRMHPAGQKVFDERDQEKSKRYSYEVATCKLEGNYGKQFRANKKAWEFYQAQAPWYRRTSCWWVMSAKREETRQRRLQTLIADSAAGRIDLLNPKATRR
jgi:uncharacterized protein YdeI (YjbR/CyaY-like superfamily)